MRDPYDVLGVSRDAGDAEIHATYRALAKRYHPDLHPNDAAAEARFKEIAAAYALLSHSEQRTRYDREHAAPEMEDRYAAFAAERGWIASASITRSPHRTRERGPINFLLIAFGLWALLSYGNGLLRGYSTALEGTIEQSTSAATPLVDNVLFRGDLRFRRYSNVYTIRAIDGGTQTYIAGPPCSLLHERPRRGARIHKEAWAWGYELDGRAVSDFTMPRATTCAIDVPFRLLFGLGPLVLGLFWRAPR